MPVVTVQTSNSPEYIRQLAARLKELQIAFDERADGWVTLTVGTTAPASPKVGDVWVDTN